MAGSRFATIRDTYWQYLGTAFKLLNTDLKTAETDIANLKAGAASAVVVTHGSNPDVPRPAGAQLVIWEGTVAPNQAAGTDFWRVP